MAESVALRDPRPLSERMLRPLRRCPDCLGTVFREVDDEEVCVKCGLVLAVNHVQERGNDGYEEETHSAAPPWMFSGLGRPPTSKDFMQMMKNNIIGASGLRDLDLRLPILKQAGSSTEPVDELAHEALEHASRKLDELGWKLRNEIGDESQSSDIVGGSVATFIRLFYSRLRWLRRFVSFKHQVVAETAIGLWLIHSGDERRIRYALGYRKKAYGGEWVLRKNVPRLTNYDPALAQVFMQVVFANG